MKNTKEKINLILAEWNPLGVPLEIALEEYKSYVPIILQYIENRQALLNCLEEIVVDKIGLDFDPNNKQHSGDLRQLCDRLIKVGSVSGSA